MKSKIILLPGDGIGPEVIASAKTVLQAVINTNDHAIEFEERLIGGISIDQWGVALTDETLDACKNADAILLGAVGGPKWDDPTSAVRPEQGLLGLRKGLELFANLRPIKPHPDLVNASPLRRERIEGVDLLVVRELTGGIYFGEPSSRTIVNGDIKAVDTMVYFGSEIDRVTHLAFQIARGRGKRVTSVDKANVLECSRLWRQNVSLVAEQYPDVELDHLLVDAAAMHLLTRANSFDVIVTANMFGDILTDEASVITGSIGNLPSASLGLEKNSVGGYRGVFEPIHGSAPDIAGQRIANPIGTILSAALLLRYSLEMEQEAQNIEAAVDAALRSGHRTADLSADAGPTLTTQEMTAVIVDNL